MNPAYHIIATSLLTGVSALAVLFFFIRVWAGPEPNGKRRELAQAADYGLVISASVGFLLVLGSIITGIFIWPWEAVLNSPLLKNKITIVVLLTLIWGVFLYLRLTRGTGLWTNPILRVYGGLLVVGGFFTNMLANSIGGDVAGNASGFEQVIRLLGIETRFSFYLPTWLIGLTLLLGLVSVSMAVMSRRNS